MVARLKALQRVGWEISDWGDDKITCGGDGLDSVQHHHKVNQFDIHTFKKDGEDYDIKPNERFVKFDLSGNVWPRTFIANVFLAERDADGGFLKFLQDLWEAIGPQVIQIASTLTIAAAGGAVGAAAGTGVEPVVGTIIGAIVGAVIALLVNYFLDSLKDDIFESPDNPLTCLLESPQSRFPGNQLRSPIYTQDFRLNSARYQMKYYWELVE